MMRDSRLKGIIGELFPLPEAAKAHEVSEGGHMRGKIVLNVAEL